ncbi:MAG: PadR family transcriptional regulator [Chloroflexota bacterium]
MERRLLLLGLLRKHGMHGYLLIAHFKSRAVIPITFKKPTVYNLLSKMEQDGWVKVREEREGNRPTRWVYEITPAGEAAYQALLRDELGSFTDAEFPSAVSLAFIDSLPKDEAKSLLEQRQTQVEERLDEVNAVIGGLDDPIHAGHTLLPMRYLKRQYLSEIEFLGELINELDSIT